MHNGRNAVTFAHFSAEAGTDGVVPAGAKLVTRVGTPLIGAAAAPGPVLPSTADFDRDPALASATVFETTVLVRVTDKPVEYGAAVRAAQQVYARAHAETRQLVGA